LEIKISGLNEKVEEMKKEEMIWKEQIKIQEKTIHEYKKNKKKLPMEGFMTSTNEKIKQAEKNV